jgi:hypothetical protein
MPALKRSDQPRVSKSSLGAIVGHPIRTRCWTILTERTASPNELKDMLGASINDVAYHVKVLRDMNVIELVDTKQRRGATEHFYRAIERAFSTDEDTASRSIENRTELARHVCQLALADQAIALEEGTFCERPDHYVTRIPLRVDEEGWRELNAAYADLVARIFDAQDNSAQRMASGESEAGIKATAVAMFFEMPDHAGAKDRSNES